MWDVFSFTFFHCRSFSPCTWLVAGSISHFVIAATKFPCCPPTKKCLLCFSSLAGSVALFLVEFCWPATYFHFFSVFLLLYIPHLWTWQLSKLNTLANTDTETIFAFRFRLYWLFSCLCFKRRRWLCDFPQNLLIEVFWYAYGEEGRSGGRCTVMWLPNFLGWVVYDIFLPMV